MKSEEENVTSEQKTVEGSELNLETPHPRLSFEEAVKIEESAVEEDSTLEPEKASRGKFSWQPNDNPDREFETLAVKANPPVLRFGRNSGNEKEGLFVSTVQLKTVFNMIVGQYDHGKQVTVVLTDGRIIKGYNVKTETRKGAYFPFRYLPAGLQLPKVGIKQPFKVAKLLIG